MNDITVNDVPLNEFLKEHPEYEKTDLEIRDVATQETSKNVLYHKPSKKYHHIKRNGKVKTLSTDEIRHLKGMYAIPFNTKTEEIIWYLFNKVTPEKGITAQEIYSVLKEPKKYSNISGMVSQIWKRLGDNGWGLLTRNRIVNKYYRYYPKETYYKRNFEEIMETYHTKQEKDLTVTETKETKQADTQEKQFEATPEQTSMIPEQIHVTFDINIRFGFLKE